MSNEKSPSHHSSSESSDSTLNDDVMISEAVPPVRSQQSRLPYHTHHEEQALTGHQDEDQNLSRPEPVERINYKHDYSNSNVPDYDPCELSSAEDQEHFTLRKYESAEWALLSYARTNKLGPLRELLDAKLRGDISLDLNFKGQQKQNYSWSALHLSCYFGHTQVVELLFSKKKFINEIKTNIQNDTGDTPLHKATLTNRVQIVQILLSNGANVFVRNCDGLLAKQLTSDRHILEMLEAAEQVDKNKFKQEVFKAVDNGELDKLNEFFENYCLCLKEAVRAESHNENDNGRRNSSSANADQQSSYLDQIHKMTDEGGNTLLHIAALRGYKAICVFLLERGFDPYRLNNSHQTCIDLSSYQLRQLFTTVKPANTQLTKLSKNRINRFEGPLLKKIRILGWRQTYVVLDNGAILLFNTRRDSMNKSRRGYKYLESAVCEADRMNPGAFTLYFSDRSRATFMISSAHLNYYNSFRNTVCEQDKSSTINAPNQVELVRQKWIDSFRDHIQYSTEFVRKGLKLNDNDDSNTDNDDISALNHLLPVDTIKSFIQDARAHYSILERHAESLCSLVQSITLLNKSNGSIESSGHSRDDLGQTNPSASSNTSGNRLLGLIRSSSRGCRASTPLEETRSLGDGNVRNQNNVKTQEFVQDQWHCILFHLRLLMESAENTKVAMNQAMTLMEHQEQLRQNKLQDQEERCRVLEDSLHALARDHHELEKSLSMSQLYHSVGTRSISTDLNEYHDAFEDFDDEKTMTPNSMPSDEDLSKKIEDVMNEEELSAPPKAGPSSLNPNDLYQKLSNYGNISSANDARNACSLDCNDLEDDDDDEDDLRSNCSALTVASAYDQSVVSLDNSVKDMEELRREEVFSSTVVFKHSHDKFTEQ